MTREISQENTVAMLACNFWKNTLSSRIKLNRRQDSYFKKEECSLSCLIILYIYLYISIYLSISVCLSVCFIIVILFVYFACLFQQLITEEANITHLALCPVQGVLVGRWQVVRWGAVRYCLLVKAGVAVSRWRLYMVIFKSWIVSLLFFLHSLCCFWSTLLPAREAEGVFSLLHAWLARLLMFFPDFCLVT